MNQLKVIEHKGQRVLTTVQLAEAYGTDGKIISNNFNRNKERYTEGKHFISLIGDEKRKFINLHQIDDGSKNASVLYLWTEKGAWMHAKSLNTDQAWDAYEMLVDDYYNVKQTLPQLTPAEILAGVANQLVEQEKRLATIETQVKETQQQQSDIKEILSLNPIDARKKINNILNKIAFANGGQGSYQDIRNESYQRLEERARCDLSIRVKNKRQRLALEGVSKSKIDKVSKLDIILDDGRLSEIYFAIVKEMAIANRVEAS